MTGLSHEQKDILILTLLARLEALESKINKNSGNSNKQPSSDGLAKKTNALRPPIIGYLNTAGAVTMRCRCRMLSSQSAARYSMCPRMPKVKQKISGCFRTIEGGKNFCVILSCFDTLRKQGNGMLEVLQPAFAGNPIQRTA